MGNADRAPTDEELERMKDQVERGMEAGAWGMSTGLIYLPGRFGLRLEDIVVATDAGPERLNHAARDLAIVE